MYRSEQRTGVLIRYGTILAIFIACLGLFGLASFSAQQRTKEIGIRKVLGASVTGIFTLFSRDLLRWVLIANLFAWPVGYVATRLWLSAFSYRTGAGFGIFLFAGLAAFLVALLTISYQSLKTARMDPVKTLKYE